MTLHVMTEKTSPKCIQWEKQSVQQSMQYAMLSLGIKRDEIIRFFPICLYMHTMNLRDETNLRKEVTNRVQGQWE